MYAYTQTQCLKHKNENKTSNDDHSVCKQSTSATKKTATTISQHERGAWSHILLGSSDLLWVLNVAPCGPLQQEVQKTAFQALQLQKDGVHGYIRQQVRRTAHTLISKIKLKLINTHKQITISPCRMDLTTLKPTDTVFNVRLVDLSFPL